MLEAHSPIDLMERVGLALGMAVFAGLVFEGIYKREGRWGPGGIRTVPMLVLVGTALYMIAPHSLLPYVVGLGAVAAWLCAHLLVAGRDGTEPPSLIIPTANLLA